MERKWMDASLAPEIRALYLMDAMTAEEKIGQLNQRLMGFRIYERNGERITLSDEFCREVEKYSGLGTLYGLYRADPWSQRGFENGLEGITAKRAYNQIQNYVMEHSRLHIPVMMSTECPHGHQALGGYLLPVNLAVGAGFDPDLLEAAARVCGAQLKEMGIHLALVSMLDVLRDPRWGRSEECYGEDPYLCGEMAAAAVRGFHAAGVQVVAKHFAAQGEGTGGVNASAARIGERELREIHLPAAKCAIDAGVDGIMAAYNEIDGIYCHANRRLLTEILREEYGFRGFVMSDGIAIDQLDGMTGDNVKSAALALNAGVDMGLWDQGFGKLSEALKRGWISGETLDQAVKRVLTSKFASGVFEHPLTDESGAQVFSYDRYHESLNLARESVILLKNEKNLLPYEEACGQTIAVIGPNAHELYHQLGDYTPPVRREEGCTFYEGMRKVFADSKVVFAEGCGLREGTEKMREEAAELAGRAHLTVLVLGGSSSRFEEASFAANGAALDAPAGTMDCGEGMDCCRLRPSEIQMELQKSVRAKAKKLVTVVNAGRPLILEEICECSDAVLLCFYSGPRGGQAAAEMIRGIGNPSGRLPVSLPRLEGQLPVYYNYKKSYPAMQYCDDSRGALYEFGYGLDYTRYRYYDERASESCCTKKMLEEHGIAVEFSVENEGSRSGTCVPQVYIRPVQSLVVPRARELKGFTRVFLNPGECKRVRIKLGAQEFMSWNPSMNREVNAGEYELRLMDQGRLIWKCIICLCE